MLSRRFTESGCWRQSQASVEHVSPEYTYPTYGVRIPHLGDPRENLVREGVWVVS
jgi:hypothetical protein